MDEAAVDPTLGNTPLNWSMTRPELAKEIADDANQLPELQSTTVSQYLLQKQAGDSQDLADALDGLKTALEPEDE